MACALTGIWCDISSFLLYYCSVQQQWFKQVRLTFIWFVLKHEKCLGFGLKVSLFCNVWFLIGRNSCGNMGLIISPELWYFCVILIVILIVILHLGLTMDANSLTGVDNEEFWDSKDICANLFMRVLHRYSILFAAWNWSLWRCLDHRLVTALFFC